MRAYKPTPCPLDHAALKLDSAAWSRLVLVGTMPTYADPPEPQTIELRNCACGSTLAIEVRP